MKFACILAGLMLNLLGLSLTSHAKEDTWTIKADMPTARSWHSTTAVNGKIYVIGGWSGGSMLSSVEEYDPITDIWTEKADMPTARVVPTIAVDGKIYAIGGWIDPNGPVLSTVEEYDPTTDTWAKKADMPTARWGLSIGVVNGKIYAIGGRGYPEVKVLATVEEYDPTTDIWTKKTDMPTPRTESANNAPTVNGKIYMIGGSLTGYPPVNENGLSTVEEYNPATDTWAKKADMPTARAMMAISEVNDKIYVIGGCPNRNIHLQTIEEYDPKTDTWTKKADMPSARYAFSASVVNGRIYAIGGGYIGNSPSYIIEEYDTGMGIRVIAISPQEGRITGNESIELFGSGFTPETNVTIGGKPLEQVKVTDTLIMGLTPSGTEGEQEIRITALWLDYSILAGKFLYKPISNINLTSVIPTNGKQAGGDMGIITGNGFMTGATVTIGGVQATDVGVTPTLITFKIPPGTNGTKEVVVTNPDGQKGILRGGYTYNPFPIIEEVEPEGGPLSGGTDLIITGSNFIQDCVVYIGGSRAPRLAFFSPTEIRLKTPSGLQGIRDVRIVNPDGQETVIEEAFSYNLPPRIKSVEPNEGPLEGGTEIIITGDEFIHPAEVFIGGIKSSYGTSVVSPTMIVAKTPPSTAGIKDIRVINGDGQIGYLYESFTYNSAPVIKSITPNNSRLSGGTRVTIVGSGFLLNAEVLVSVEDASSLPNYLMASSVEVMSNNIITAIMPPCKAGVRRIVVVNRDGQRVESAFTYNILPTISKVTPNYGPTSGGTKIVIEGTGFLQGVRVMVGDRSATAQLKDDMTIEAVTPPNSRGVWDVRVVNPDTQEAIAPKGFISVGELVYNFPNPFRSAQGTTFRYVTNVSVQSITVRIFNIAGVPIDIVHEDNSKEVRWQNNEVHVGMYIYDMEVKLSSGETKHFKRMLEVCK